MIPCDDNKPNHCQKENDFEAFDVKSEVKDPKRSATVFDALKLRENLKGRFHTSFPSEESDFFHVIVFSLF